MGIFTTYLLNIVGIVVISVIVDVVLSDSKIANHVKSVMALLCVFVIVVPLPNLITEAKNQSNYEVETALTVDENFISTVNDDKAVSLKSTLEKKILEAGIEGVTVNITLNKSSLYFDVSKITIEKDVGKITGVISSAEKDTIKKIILSYITVSADNIVFV